MRIAIFHNLPSGGAKRTLYEQARRLSARHTLDVFSVSSADHTFGDLRSHVANYIILPFDPLPLLRSPFGRANQALRLADLFRLRRPLRQIARQIEVGDYDLLLVHPCQLETASSLLAYVNSRVATVYYCHEPPRRLYECNPHRPYDKDHLLRRQILNRFDPLPFLYQAILRRIDWRNTRQANLVLVNSIFTQKAVQRIYQVESRVSYHGVDVDRFRPLSIPRKRIILSVGSITPLKGFDFLIEAVGQIPVAMRPPLIVASNFQNPPERNYLIQLADSLDVDLKLLINISDEQLVRLYNEAAVIAYTPIREPFGLVPLEAMACGSPIVAVREGGTQESICHGETGLLVERNSNLFAQSLLQLLTDLGLATTYGRNGREQVLRHWRWSQAINRLQDYLEEIRFQPIALNTESRRDK